jgi:hypothetical protein
VTRSDILDCRAKRKRAALSGDPCKNLPKA